MVIRLGRCYGIFKLSNKALHSGLAIRMSVVMLMFTINLYAQLEQKDYKQLTTLDGLSDHRITSIIQDDLGYIWIGTYEGLNRYDGLSFKKYLHSDDPTSIPHSHVDKIIYLGNNRLAILTRGGLQVFNTETNKSVNFLVPDSTAFGLHLNLFWDIVEISHIGFLASTATGFYLFNYSGKLVWRYDHHSASEKGTGFHWGRELYPLSDSAILCYNGNYGYAMIFNPKTHQIEEADPTLTKYKYLEPILRHKRGSMIHLGSRQFMYSGPLEEGIGIFDASTHKKDISNMSMNPKSEFDWPGFLVKLDDSLLIQAAGSGGFFVLQKNNRELSVKSDGIRHFEGHTCTAFFKDKNNRLWIGTEYGLWMQSFNQPFIKNTDIRPLISRYSKSKSISDVFYADNILYFSSGTKDGVTTIDATTMEFQKSIRLSESVEEWNDIRCIGSLNHDTLWFGSTEGLVYYDVKRDIAGKVNQAPFDKGNISIESIYKDSRSNIWMGIRGRIYGVLFFDHQTRTFKNFSITDSLSWLPLKSVSKFVEDSQGNVWVAGRGIARFNYAIGKFDSHITTFAGFHKFQDHVLAMSSDDHGHLWIATASNGLLKYTIAEETFKHYTTANSLSRDLILSLSESINDQIFIANRSHIDVLDLRTDNVHVLGHPDGLPLAPMSSSFTYDTLNHRMWAAYDDIIVTIPTKLKVAYYPPPKIVVELINVPQDTIIAFPRDRIELPHLKNSMSIIFTWMDFDDADHVRTFYRLNPRELWIDLNRSNTIVLNQLSSGTYQLEIKVKSILERWPEQIRTLTIHIKPPFYREAWFILLLSATVFLCIYFLYKRHIKQIQAAANADKLMADYEMKALHSQMNPHFIFNCLNSIKEMILFGDKDKAGFYLSRFAQLIRDTLDHSRRSFITLEQLIDYINRYIEMEKIRFSDFTYSIQLHPDVHPRQTKMPPMLIQPLIENAIWHGLSPLTGKKQLDIIFFNRDENIVCQVIDNGIGISESMKRKNEDRDSTGIENIYKRIDLLNQKYKTASSLTLKDRSELEPGEHGTIAELAIYMDIE